ncbi:CAP domain-containing protein [Sporolactobacillus pectinivorans]|uniref:CAP domain-containing protein n=1 Tax=Sporolactobacillus pectinivorans TaxID=1591408 RepID=UPI001EFC8D03|nr:CAP domain-containing protein [Sporolactobacillus pectinivorans]
MRKINIIIFSIAVLIFTGTFLTNQLNFPETGSGITNNQQPALQGASETRPLFSVPRTGIHTFMGKDETQILKAFGKPDRIDETEYGYRWFIYGRNTSSYLQIGIDTRTHRVTTIYVLGNKLQTAPFEIGEQSRAIFKKMPPSHIVSMTDRGTKIDFELSGEDMTVRPLVKFGTSWVQLNFDHVTGRLMAIRYMSPDVLALQRPYSMAYEGTLPQEPALSDKEWQAVDDAEDMEIFDMSNLLRIRFKKAPLAWSASAHQAAFLHSREMKIKNYFSHDSKWSGDLKTRLEKEKITFLVAGENIAARYPDAAAVTIGWLNSIDHRKNLLNADFSELGVGSYQNYYTQDFVQPMGP